MKVNSTMIRIFIVLDRHLWSSDITDFMFLLLDNFSQKVSNSQRLYVVFSHSAIVYMMSAVTSSRHQMATRNPTFLL